MAQSRDSARSGANTPATAGKSSGATPPAPTSETPSGRFNFARLSRLLGPRPAAGQQAGANNGQTAKRSGWGRLLFGMVIFIVAAQVGEYALVLLSTRFPQWRLVQDTVVPKNAFPLLDSMSRFNFIYLLFIVLVYVGLFRFNVIPRDPFGAKARAAERTAAANRPATTGSSGGTRAERRYSARNAATTTSSKPASARQVAAQARATASAAAAAPNGSDSEYERVKAAQRQRRRRATKR
jgi:hypothetical protein